MLVSELIEILKGLPAAAEVVCANGEMPNEFVRAGKVSLVQLASASWQPDILICEESKEADEYPITAVIIE